MESLIKIETTFWISKSKKKQAKNQTGNNNNGDKQTKIWLLKKLSNRIGFPFFLFFGEGREDEEKNAEQKRKFKNKKKI